MKQQLTKNEQAKQAIINLISTEFSLLVFVKYHSAVKVEYYVKADHNKTPRFIGADHLRTCPDKANYVPFAYREQATINLISTEFSLLVFVKYHSAVKVEYYVKADHNKTPRFIGAQALRNCPDKANYVPEVYANEQAKQAIINLISTEFPLLVFVKYHNSKNVEYYVKADHNKTPYLIESGDLRSCPDKVNFVPDGYRKQATINLISTEFPLLVFVKYHGAVKVEYYVEADHNKTSHFIRAEHLRTCPDKANYVPEVYANEQATQTINTLISTEFLLLDFVKYHSTEKVEYYVKADHNKTSHFIGVQALLKCPDKVNYVPHDFQYSLSEILKRLKLLYIDGRVSFETLSTKYELSYVISMEEIIPIDYLINGKRVAIDQTLESILRGVRYDGEGDLRSMEFYGARVVADETVLEDNHSILKMGQSINSIYSRISTNNLKTVFMRVREDDSLMIQILEKRMFVAFRGIHDAVTHYPDIQLDRSGHTEVLINDPVRIEEYFIKYGMLTEVNDLLIMIHDCLVRDNLQDKMDIDTILDNADTIRLAYNPDYVSPYQKYRDYVTNLVKSS